MSDSRALCRVTPATVSYPRLLLPDERPGVDDRESGENGGDDWEFLFDGSWRHAHAISRGVDVQPLGPPFTEQSD